MIYIIRMSFLINGKLQFVEISSLGYSTQDKAFEAMKRHQEIHVECDYKHTPSNFVLEKVDVDTKDIYEIKYEIIKVVKAID